MPNVDINWLAVVVATGINMVVGAVWYSPALFFNDWAKLIGKKKSEMSDSASSYILTTIGAFVQSLILSLIIGWSGVATAAKGAYLGLLLWIAFVAVTAGVDTVFSGGRKKLWAIQTGYFLVVLVVNGALLAAWR